MKITLVGVPVQDQARALAFYTEKLGFEVKHDIPMGEHRWLTVTSPEGAAGVELLLEPIGFAPARDYYGARYDAGIPCAQFESADIQAEYERLVEKGVVFKGEPQEMGGAKAAIFDDTCGNYICIVEPMA